MTFKWICDPRIKKSFLLRRNISYREHLKWFENYKSDSSQKIFAIIEEGTHCGNCGFKFINDLDKKAELWIYLGDVNFEGKGVASNALRMLIDFGFDKLGLNKIYLHVAIANIPALKLYSKFGFATEGEFRDEMKIDNEYVTIKRLCRFKIEEL